MSDFPDAGVELTQILVVSNLDRARDWYLGVLGAELHGEYGGTSLVLRFGGAWLLVVTGGPPTPDKPDVTFEPPPDPRSVSHAITIRVADCDDAYRALNERGATFLTPPVSRGHETRAFFRDPDGHLFEISSIRG